MEGNSEIINAWNTLGHQLAIGLFALGVVMLLGYIMKLAATSDPKNKYDFINKNEINFLWYTTIVIIAAGAIYANTFIVQFSLLWLFVRLFVTIMMSIITGVIVQNLLKFYYPFYIEKRLKKLRYQPRVSSTGGTMKLLSEDEEDVYLDEGMQAEEDIFSIDYDVWIDEETKETKIEKYSGHLHAVQCPECNYQTLKVTKEEVLKSPSDMEEGELIKFFDCGYCGHKSKKSFKIAMLREGDEA